MSKMQHCKLLYLLALALAAYGDDITPEVTLSHGGSLFGRRISFQGVEVDLFQGIRFAKPPVRDLRFKKTEKYPAWHGKMAATSAGNRCPQIVNGQVMGDEDCLFMDITVPGGVRAGAKKAVMVWIHGGAYMFGTGSVFLGTPLAVTGDVIYVTFNYRVSILGFLADGPGTGNFGLWDQRTAILWVKENIEQFGGDPDMITIFGESAGAGSVSSQVIGQHNDGLFKRAIQQSGTLYQMLPTSINRWCKLSKSIRQQTNCTSTGKIYDCLRDMTPAQLLTQIQVAPWESFWHPFADNDFFGDDVYEYSYKQSQRFDLLMGMNGEEGGIMLALDAGIFAMINQRSLDDGVDLAFVREYLTFGCPYWFAPYSAALCADFVIHNYGLDTTANDIERGLRLRDFLGEVFFGADIANQLVQHSGNNLETSTYAYYFTEPITKANSMWKLPKWAKSMADHADELLFVFGGPFYKEIEDPTWQELVARDEFIHGLLVGGAEEEDKSLSQAMMTMWTNFAKTGDPNKPTPLPEGMPTWPRFNKDTNQFLELNSNNIRVVTTPHKERLEKIQSHIYAARKLQFAADRPSPEDEIRWMEALNGLENERMPKKRDEL